MIIDGKKQRLPKSLFHVQLFKKKECLPVQDSLYQLQILTPSKVETLSNQVPSSINLNSYKLSTQLHNFIKLELLHFICSVQQLYFRGIAELSSKGIRVELTPTFISLTLPKDVYEQFILVGQKLKNNDFYHNIRIPLSLKHRDLIFRISCQLKAILTDTFDFILCGDHEFFTKLSNIFPNLETCPISSSLFTTSQYLPLFEKWILPLTNNPLKRKREGKARTHLDSTLRYIYSHLIEWIGCTLHQVPAISKDPYISMHAMDPDIQASSHSLIHGTQIHTWIPKSTFLHLLNTQVSPWSIYIAKTKPSHLCPSFDLIIINVQEYRLLYRVPVVDPFLFSIK